MTGQASRMWVAAATGILAVAIAALWIMPARGEQPKLSVTVEWDGTNPKGEGAFWLLYLMTRARVVSQHLAEYVQAPGPITPTFDEEAEGRIAIARMYRETRAKDRGPNVSYFGVVERVERAGFIREYVWTYLRQTSWQTQPENLKLGAFEAWRKRRLDGHRAITKGRVTFMEEKQ